MNKDQALSAVRSILLIVGALLTKHGIDTGGVNWADVSGLVVAAFPLVWSFWHHGTKAEETDTLFLKLQELQKQIDENKKGGKLT